jgi:fatty acid desaturase
MEPLFSELVKKSHLADSTGQSYKQFKASLKPKYAQVWFDIFLGYGLQIATLVGVAYMQQHFPSWFWLTIPLGALLTGYWFAFTHLYIHEASHYNIAPDKKMNDLLADIFIGMIAGSHIKFYRVIHFDHHRYLGTTRDTENTYFEPLNWRFIIESLTGIRVFRVVGERNKIVQAVEGLNPDIIRTNKQMTIAGAFINLGILIAFFATGYWQVAITWAGAIGVMFPFFLSLRQLLEHRSEYAKANVDYTKENQGETNRMFGVGLIASTLGSAGFNRHLLHHWDPSVSCTRLRDLELYLRDTELAKDMAKTNTNYFSTFIRLFNK